MLIVFTNWSLRTPTENVQEIYINHHKEGKSFRVVVLDDNNVDLKFYKADAKVTRLVLSGRTIYEGENMDVEHPRIYPNK